MSPTPLHLVVPLCLAVAAPAGAETALSLAEAERIALDLDPTVRGYEAQSAAFTDRAVAEGQLPDPQLKFGIDNLVTDSFAREDDDMTQLVVGVQQAFPRGHTLRYQSERMQTMSEEQVARAANQRLLVQQAVRSNYLELHYQRRAEAILAENRKLFQELQTITERQYAAGRDNHHDVIRSQLELSLLDDRLAQVVTEREQAIAELARWIGPQQAARPLAEDLPVFADAPPRDALAAGLPGHPQIGIEDALVAAGEKSVAIAGEQYKPGFMVDLSYGNRADMPDGGDRPDMMSAIVTMDLPLFREKRQDRSLAASRQEVTVATYNRAERLRDLTRALDAEYAKYLQLGERMQLYEKRAMVESDQNVEATLIAYETARADFIDMLRARVTALDTRLALLRLGVDRAKARANLMYLAGE